jgi:hypothetical protein
MVNELERLWKEAEGICFKDLSGNSNYGTEENHETPSHGKSVSGRDSSSQTRYFLSWVGH